VSEILARIKALLAPGRPPASPLDGVPVSAAPVTETAEARRSEPIATVEEVAPVAETAPFAEPATAIAEAPEIAEAPASAEVPASAEAPIPPRPAVTAPPAGGLMLRLETERGLRSTFEVTKSGATIGRGPESTIQLPDLSVSRKHARITYKQGAYWLSDLGSMGGTWIDGTKLAAPRRVATGQTIDIGVCRLTVVFADAEAESPAAKVSR
jgi:hypothetical protein